MKKIDGLSIIIPCYNVEKYIATCLESIKKQNINVPYEIILVDDCSKDKTTEVINNYIKKNDNIKLLKNKENKGAGYSRNKAIKESCYSYISFIDSDDYLDDNFYEEMITKITNNQADVIVCDINCVYEDGSPDIVAPGCEGKVSKLNIINTGFAASPCNKIIKKELLIQYPFCEGIMNEDIASILAIIASCTKIIYTNKTKYNYVQHASSVQNSSLSDKRFDIFISVAELEKRIKNNSQYDEFIKAVAYQQLFLFFIFIIPREKNLFKRSHYLKLFRKKAQKYDLGNNELCKENLERRGKKAYFLYNLLFKLNDKGFSFITSLILAVFQVYHEIKHHSFISKKISVIKDDITLDDLIVLAKKQQKMRVGNKTLTVVVPNYNYDEFLYQRLYSILYQKYKISEFIILDDCSTDDSRSTIDEIVESLKEFINIKSIYNDNNSGTAFKQWEKGFSLATSDYVWIAEADDYCEKTLIKSLMKPINSENDIMISYADTAFINKKGIKILKSIKPEIDILNTHHWDQNFINSGQDEIKNYCYLNCTIANVSSCIIKKGEYDKYFKASGEFKQAGDWLFYINIMQNGKIAFINKPLNYYRVHGNNVTSTTKKERHLEEIKKIHKYVTKEFDLKHTHQDNMKKRIKFLEHVWDLDR